MIIKTKDHGSFVDNHNADYRIQNALCECGILPHSGAKPPGLTNYTQNNPTRAVYRVIYIAQLVL